jgi:hypothetical protein
VGVNAHVIHRNKEVFGEDAETFRPERWIDSDPEQVKLMDRSWLVVSTSLHYFSLCARGLRLIRVILFSLAMAYEPVSGKIYRSWRLESWYRRF